LVGDRIAAKDEIARVFYRVRGVNSSVEIKPLSVEELAERAASVAQRELAAWAENLLLIAANDVIGAAFPTWAQVGEQLRALYRAAFARAERSLVLVPHRCSGEDLLDALFAARKLTR
jgi:hypothetical protein